MPLTLVTGPANAEKAGHVLGAYRAALDRSAAGEDAGGAALLVVPTFADVEHYRRELAAGGAVFGVQVVTFGRLLGEIGRRAGVGGRALGRLARERVAGAAVAATRLERLAASAATPGFVSALLRLADELEERRVDPGRWYAALRAWAAADPGQAAYAEELAALYGAYRDGLARLGRVDRTLRDVAALDALRLAPARWGASPVFVYGFDDLRPLQRDAIETLAVHAGAEVTVSLTYERGRAAFAGRGATFQELLALGPEHVELPARAGHAVPALHHLERTLFEDGTEPAGPPPAEGAVALLEGGGERAELELVAAHVARLLREGHAPEDVAVVLREPREQAALVEQVFGALGVAVAVDRRVPAGHTALGRGLVGLLRSALLDADADDLLAWLRTPGKLERAALADRLEAEARRTGARTAAAARALWEGEHPDFLLHELDRVAEAAARGPAALCERLAGELNALFAAPHRGRAPVLDAEETLDARVAAGLRGALDELRGLVQGAPALAPAPDELARLLAGYEVADAAPAGAVAVTSPLAVRARRVRALFVCGLREGAFPRPGRPEPFLGDAERRAINAASGLRLRLREDRLDAERFLLYQAVSRPSELLVLSWPAADDEGEPHVRSLFVDDVLDRVDPTVARAVARRPLGAVGFDEGLAPTAREALRARLAAAPAAAPPPIASLRDPEVLAELAGRETWSASALEAYAGCPVRWFVERLLSPESLTPDPEPMLRGELAHRVLEEALRALADGGDRVGAAGTLVPERLDEARAHLHAALERHAAQARISVNPERLRSHLRRLEADLLRYVDHAAHAGSALAPAHFELRFGRPEDEREPVALAGGELRLAGRIDRVDVDPGGRATGSAPQAIVYDYKGRSAPPQAKWLAEARLQVGLYMLALPELLGLEAVGGLYQPLGGDDARPRGLLRADADPGLASVDTDRLDDDAFAERLGQVLDAALAAVRAIRAGTLVPRPGTCAYGGGCAHPSICRCEAAGA
jgi:ATP-dependent helicase/DNAse subunit B